MALQLQPLPAAVVRPAAAPQPLVRSQIKAALLNAYTRKDTNPLYCYQCHEGYRITWQGAGRHRLKTRSPKADVVKKITSQVTCYMKHLRHRHGIVNPTQDHAPLTQQDLAQQMDYLAQRMDLVRRLDVAEAALMQMRADWEDVVRQAVGRVLEIVNPDQYHAPLILQDIVRAAADEQMLFQQLFQQQQQLCRQQQQQQQQQLVVVPAVGPAPAAQLMDLERRLQVVEAALMQMRANWEDVVRQAVGRVLAAAGLPRPGYDVPLSDLPSGS